MKLSTSLFGKTYRYETIPEFIKQLTEDMNKAEAKYKKIEKEYENEKKKFHVIRKAIQQLTGEKPTAPAKPTTSTATNENNS